MDIRLGRVGFITLVFLAFFLGLAIQYVLLR